MTFWRFILAVNRIACPKRPTRLIQFKYELKIAFEGNSYLKPDRGDVVEIDVENLKLEFLDRVPALIKSVAIINASK